MNQDLTILCAIIGAAIGVLSVLRIVALASWERKEFFSSRWAWPLIVLLCAMWLILPWSLWLVLQIPWMPIFDAVLPLEDPSAQHVVPPRGPE